MFIATQSGGIPKRRAQFAFLRVSMLIEHCRSTGQSFSLIRRLEFTLLRLLLSLKDINCSTLLRLFTVLFLIGSATLRFRVLLVSLSISPMAPSFRVLALSRFSFKISRPLVGIWISLHFVFSILTVVRPRGCVSRVIGGSLNGRASIRIRS